MTQRQAMRHAHLQAYAILQSHLDSDSEFETANDDELKKVRKAIDLLAQRHWELSSSDTASGGKKQKAARR